MDGKPPIGEWNQSGCADSLGGFGRGLIANASYRRTLWFGPTNIGNHEWKFSGTFESRRNYFKPALANWLAIRNKKIRWPQGQRIPGRTN